MTTASISSSTTSSSRAISSVTTWWRGSRTALCSYYYSLRTISIRHGAGRNWSISSARTPMIPTNQLMSLLLNFSHLRHSQTFQPISRISASGSSTHNSGTNWPIPPRRFWVVIRVPKNAVPKADVIIGSNCMSCETRSTHGSEPCVETSLRCLSRHQRTTHCLQSRCEAQKNHWVRFFLRIRQMTWSHSGTR